MIGWATSKAEPYRRIDVLSQWHPRGGSGHQEGCPTHSRRSCPVPWSCNVVGHNALRVLRRGKCWAISPVFSLMGTIARQHSVPAQPCLQKSKKFVDKMTTLTDSTPRRPYTNFSSKNPEWATGIAKAKAMSYGCPDLTTRVDEQGTYLQSTSVPQVALIGVDRLPIH